MIACYFKSNPTVQLSTPFTRNDMAYAPPLSTIEESVASTLNISMASSVPRTAKTLTVLKKGKVEAELKKKMNTIHKSSRIAPVIKWFAAIILGLTLLASIVASKFSLIRLTQRLRQTMKNADDDSSKRIECTRLFLMLVFIIVVPTALNFLRAVWIGGCRKDLPWPKKKAVVLTVVTALMESTGLCIFAFKILTSYNEATGVMLISTVLFIPFINNIQRLWVNRLDPNLKFKLIMVIICTGLLLELGGFGIMGYFSYKDIDGDKNNIFHLPVAIVCLSLAWSPAVQKRMIQSNVLEDVEVKRDEAHSMRNLAHTTSTQYSVASSVDSTRANATSTTNSVASSVDSTRTDAMSTMNSPKTPELPCYKTSTWKTSIISHAVKLPSIFIISFLLFYFDYWKEGLSDQTYREFKDAWDNWTSTPEFKEFVVNIVTSFLGYLLGFLACHSSMQQIGFAVPLLLSLPAYVFPLLIPQSCSWILDGLSEVCVEFKQDELGWAAAVLLVLGFIVSTTWFVFRNDPIILRNESQIFWLPSFNGVFLDQWLLVNRRCHLPDKAPDEIQVKFKSSRVYICTTMYRETRSEMDQLLESINRVNIARKDGGRFFESHVIFDGGVKKNELSSFALQLISRLEQTLGIIPEDCTKLITPYGMRLSWKLPSPQKCQPMNFIIHLKDNHKVKNKKRWSQVMYMSYILDFLTDDASDEESFILTTDADVMFKPDSVGALLDLMTRDSAVGAVCARTHPMGSGPMVWYQIFEYAVGHWFQKAAEHVLGSVLCAPGCFSVYRCRALKDILPTYATGVEYASEFLTKDMGEDRWLCTLMVQSGWRIEYCAASENRTNCPQEFEEFYKQRRRWIASTIANLMLILKDWKVISHFNKRVSLLFVLYQGALLFSTLISPSTVILVVSGGLTFAWDTNPVTSIVLQIFVSVGFVLVCLYASDKIQILTAQILTFLYAIVMSAVAVGTAEQIVLDFTTTDKDVGFGIGLSITTIYFICLAGMFLLAAMLHPGEFLCLMHALWYLLCLPSGYLVLNLYSICNLTDRSWGTREEKTESSIKKEPWQTKVTFWFQKIFFCCFKADENSGEQFDVEKQTPSISQSRKTARERRISSSGDAQDTYPSSDITPQLRRISSSGDAQDTYPSSDITPQLRRISSSGDAQDTYPSSDITPQLRRISSSGDAQDTYPSSDITPQLRRISSSGDAQDTYPSSDITPQLRRISTSGDAQDTYPSSDITPQLRRISSSGDAQDTYPSSDITPQLHRISSSGDAQDTYPSSDITPQLRRISSSGIAQDTYPSLDPTPQLPHPTDSEEIQELKAVGRTSQTMDENDETSDSDDGEYSQTDDVPQCVPVEVWLPEEFKIKYAHAFRQHGFDDTSFISGMNAKELKHIGIKTKTHKQFILGEIDFLSTFEIDYDVPTNVSEWLKTIGLSMYEANFRRCHILRPADLSILKTFGRNEMEKELRITKDGHLKRLMYAIRKLRNPTEDEKKAIEMKNKIKDSPPHRLRECNIGEYVFWRRLRDACLKPGTKAFGIEEELKSKLSELRNSWLLIFAVCNTLWLILITTLASKVDLTVLGANPIGLSFLFIFGSLFLVQFLAMCIHRFSTAVHFMARAPYKCGAPLQTVWSFTDENLQKSAFDSDEWDRILMLRQEEKRIRERQNTRIKRTVSISERTPLLSRSPVNIV